MLATGSAASSRYPFADDRSRENFEALVRLVSRGRVSVIIGAGLSQRAGLPGWSGLIDALYNASSLSRLSSAYFRAERVIEEIQRLREDLGDRYLEILREHLDPPGLLLPDAYQIVGRAPFRHFATTNVDELLYLLATVVNRDPDESVWVYL